MPLIQLWEKSPDIVLQYNIKQIVSSAGDGVLADHNECSKELRSYLGNVHEERLFEYVRHCLGNGFDKSGLVLQDIINEMGRRLDYVVEDGLYQGRTNQVGFDGIWSAPDGHALVIEIKTTDAYRINLDTIAAYRSKLISSQKITENSSILIVVGRNDTGDLEAQIRGSRHAWDARIISMESLMKLVELKVKSDEDETIEKIRSLLIPFEYTRLDNIIDVMFTAAKDVESSSEDEKPANESGDLSILDDDREYTQEHTPRAILDAVRMSALGSFNRLKNVFLIAHKRSQFWTADKSVRVVCPVSKKYRMGNYWYAFHPHQQKFLEEARDGFLILACIDSDKSYALPYGKILEILPFLNTTDKGEKTYWHIHLQPIENGGHVLLLSKRGEKLDLQPYVLKMT